MNLVIVESPTKARTIGKFLGSDYTIKATIGHLVDLPKSKIGIDFEHNFEPQYEIVSDKKKIISELKTAAKGSDSIILATDPDREGEAIAAHVKDLLGTNGKFKRVVFHEITKDAIDEAFKNPRDLDAHLVDAQTARRVLDRLVGYKLSPILWRKVRRGLSAGRVQSVALRLIVEREREIEKFKKEEYWTISVLLSRQPRISDDAHLQSFNNQSLNSSSLSKSRLQAEPKPTFSSSESRLPPQNSTVFDLVEINGEKIEVSEKFNLYDGEYSVTKTSISNEEQAKKISSDLRTKKFVVADVLQKEMQRSPQPPYTTSTLQQDASRRLGFAGRRTMRTAQKLYEEGLITYHRTDSVAIAMSAQNGIRNFINTEFGSKYLPQKPRFYATKQKLAQEAHEGIRPTHFSQILSIKNQVSSAAGNDGWKLYELIWRRAIASQMTNAIIESTTVLVDAQGRTHLPGVPQAQHHLEGGEVELAYKLKANGSVLMFDGFLKVNPQALQDNKLPQFSAKQNLDLTDIKSEQHGTPPPARYNDASLIKALEEKGIGRPSTYATIISTIEDRKYIERGDPITGSGRAFVPTPIGVAVNDFLVANFSDIDDIAFTAQMEDELDNIAHGKLDWRPMIKAFYDPFEKKLEIVSEAARVKIAVEEINEKCPECQSPLVIRMGRFGRFISCSKFPECKFTKPYVEKTDILCPKDGGQIVIKRTRRGKRFYGCSNYPKCDFAAWKLEDIKKN